MRATCSSFAGVLFADLNRFHFIRSEHYTERKGERHFDERLLLDVLCNGRHSWENRGRGEELASERYYPDVGTWRVVVRQAEGLCWTLVSVVWKP